MARRQANKLTAREVAGLSREGWHGDGAGLWLRIGSDGRRSWTFVYKLNGKRHEMGLGTAAGAYAVSLAAAREAAAVARAQLQAGVSPLEERRRKVAAVQAEDTAKAIPTFGKVADDHIEAMSSSWRNPKHRKQWEMTLEKYAAPIRDMRIDTVTTEDVLEVLRPHWQKRPETAQRLRGRLEIVLDRAKAQGWRTGDNPARWRGHLANLLPARQSLTRGHHAALPYKALPTFISDLQARKGISALMLEFTILTAVRTNEARLARWQDIDIAGRIWTIPAENKKEGRSHRVPLSERTLNILKELAKAKLSDFVFPGRGKKPLSQWSMLMLLRRMDREDITVHGFRSAFRDWALEVSTFPSDVVEMALAHSVGSKTERAYRRGDALEKRSELMKAWAIFCAPKGGNVIPLRAKQ